MSISFKYVCEEGLLKITTQGKDDNLQEVEKYARKILGLAIENKCTKLICDERELVYSIDIFETFELAEAASIEAKCLKQIGIVCNEKYLEDGKFYETVTRNRGLNVLVTSDYDHAIDWLK